MPTQKRERLCVPPESKETLRLSSLTSCVRLSTAPALRRTPLKAHSKAMAFLDLAPQVPSKFAWTSLSTQHLEAAPCIEASEEQALHRCSEKSRNQSPSRLDTSGVELSRNYPLRGSALATDGNLQKPASSLRAKSISVAFEAAVFVATSFRFS